MHTEPALLYQYGYFLFSLCQMVNLHMVSISNPKTISDTIFAAGLTRKAPKPLSKIGIYRLTSLSDGIGELTADGMNFTATDAAGNPIRGIITADGQAATVTFTDSTWDYLQNGSAFQYTKSSDTSNIWNE